MLHQIHTLNTAEEYLHNTGFIDSSKRADSFLYFDIETTGLSAKSSFLYLIGCMYIKDGEVKLEQFFSEGPEDEVSLLNAFSKLAEGFETVVHFNGQTFDIPYIVSKSCDHNVDTPLPHMQSFDLYQKLRPLKEILRTDSMKQKALERAAGIDRTDRFDGGELITVYNRYLALRRLEKIRSMSASGYKPRSNSGLANLSGAGASSSDELLKFLLLHNYEDVKNMLPITALLGIRAFFEGAFNIVSVEETDHSVDYHLNASSSIALPELDLSKKTSGDFAPYTLRTSSNRSRIILSVPTVDTELKLFFDNYKDYWYLPAEDSAIHDSIGSFMDRSVKVKATKQTAYTRTFGRFIPLPIGIRPEGIKTFRTDYKSKQLFITYADRSCITEQTLIPYLTMFI